MIYGICSTILKTFHYIDGILVIILLQVRKIQLDLLDICFLLVVVYIEEEVGMASEEIAV